MTKGDSENLFWRLLRSESSSVTGHEDFVTEAFRTILAHDHALIHSFVKETTHVDLPQNETLQVSSQSTYNSVQVGSCCIDLEIRSNSLFLFVEDKISASLGKYRIEEEVNSANAESETIDQITKYDRLLGELDESYPANRHLILISQDPAKIPNQSLRYFKESYLWWDIYKIIDKYHQKAKHNERDYSTWLRSQFLEFLELSHLDPPKALRKKNFESSSAVRLLAEAIQEYGEYENVGRAHLDTGFYVIINGRRFEIWFDAQPSFRAAETKRGGLKLPELTESFWEASEIEQRTELKKIISGLPAFDTDEKASVSVREAIEQFDPKIQEHVQDLLDRLTKIWPQDPSTGKKVSAHKEISIGTGNIRIRFAPYRRGHLVVRTGTERVDQAARIIGDYLNCRKEQLEIWKTQVNVPFQLLRENGARRQMIEAIKDLAKK